MGFVGVHVESFLHSVASPFYSFETIDIAAAPMRFRTSQLVAPSSVVAWARPGPAPYRDNRHHA